MSRFDSKAYTEVYEIINMLSDEEKEKIPPKWHALIEAKRDKNYEFNPREDDVELLEDTEKILSVLYTDFLSTSEERRVILAKEKSWGGTARVVGDNSEKNNEIEYKEIKRKEMVLKEGKERFIDKIMRMLRKILKKAS